MMLYLIAIIVVGVRLWRRRRNRLKVESHRNMYLSDRLTEIEGNPLLADWAQEMGSKLGLQLLAEKTQSDGGENYLQSTSSEVEPGRGG